MKLERACVAVVLAMMMVCVPGEALAETLERGHQRFYSTGQVLKIGDIVDLGAFGEGSILSVSVTYSMVRSQLEADWLYNGEVVGHTRLEQGQQRTATFEYGKRLPASVELRFAGQQGQIQVLVVRVVALPPQQVSAGSGMGVNAGGGTAQVGVGVGLAATPTPRQVVVDKPDQILPADPKAVGFDDSGCERLVCTLPPGRLEVRDTGQDYVSSFYMFIQHAPKAAREEMPPPGHCAWWARPMADGESREILAAAYNTRIDIELTWEPDLRYSLRPHRANIYKDPDEPARFIRLWDSVMAGAWLDLCVTQRKVYSVDVLDVVGQY